jgi:hypothetical protein
MVVNTMSSPLLQKLNEDLQKLGKALVELQSILRELKIMFTPVQRKPPSWAKETVVLKTNSGEPLATFYTGGRSALVIAVSNKKVNVNVSPFKGWFVEKVLEKMKEKDEANLRAGVLKQEEVFAYKIQCDGELLIQIQIENVNPERVKELKTSLRWTLEKVYEKTIS